MAAMGFSAGLRKAGELARRRLSLAVATPRMVIPKASYPSRGHDGVLILQRGVNASTDYYLRPRLQGAAPFEILDLQSPPSRSLLLSSSGGEALLVIICRYASAPWLEALEKARHRLSRVAFFMDDDLPAMMADPSLPMADRGKVARHFADHVEALGALSGEVWVSTQVLAERYAAARPIIVEPLPEADPPEPAAGPIQRVVYHGAGPHRGERRFVLEVARRLQKIAPEAIVEIAGDAAFRSSCRREANVSVTPLLPWPDYLARARRERAAVSLAPLEPTVVNAARSPIKAFDAARLGAAGIFADAPPFRGFIRDGVDGLIAPMDADAWAGLIADLLAQPERRRDLALAARARLTGLRARRQSFPEPPAA